MGSRGPCGARWARRGRRRRRVVVGGLGGGDGWVPYGLPQLSLVVQLALQAARALLRGVRLLLQAPDLPPHRLQRAAPRHRAGGGGRAAVGEAGCCAAAAAAALSNARPPRPGLAAPRRRPLRPRTSPEVAVSRAAQANRRRVRERRGRAQRAGRGAQRGPREFANRGRRCACSLLRGWKAWGTHHRAPGGLGGPCRKRGHRSRGFISIPSAPPRLRVVPGQRAWLLRALVPPTGGRSAPLRIPYSQAQEGKPNKVFGA